jgi:uncharacterized DUF497 family protein
VSARTTCYAWLPLDASQAVAIHSYCGYNNCVPITFDPSKNQRNIESRGLSFSLADDFEWDTALIVEDIRQEYGERRFQALGLIHDQLHMLVFTPRDGAIHVISLRRANRRERNRYATQARS